MRIDPQSAHQRPITRAVSGTLARPGSAATRPPGPAFSPDSPRALRLRADDVEERIIALERQQLVGRPLDLAEIDALTATIAALHDAIAETRARRHGPEALTELFAARRTIAGGLAVVLDLLARVADD